MQQIKFRGRREDNGWWVYGYYFQTPLTNETGVADSFLSGGEPKHQIADWGVVFEVDPKTIGQLTGRQDINDKYIYSGDILKIDDEVGYVEYMEETTEYIVDFWKKGQTQSKGDSLASFREVEVIGNTYENPELLK